MRHLLSILTLTTGLLLSQAAWADYAAEFEAVAELPTAQVVCIGEAALPAMLRFAFQPEPEMSGRPEIIRVSATRRPAGRVAAPRPATRQVARPAGPPTLRLPCIQG